MIGHALGTLIEVLRLDRAGHGGRSAGVRRGTGGGRRFRRHHGFRHDRAVVRRLSRPDGEVGDRAEDDLIDLHAVLARLDAQSASPGRRELHGRGLREPPGTVLPAPIGHAARAAWLEVHEEPRRGADAVDRCVAGGQRVAELQPHRVVPLRVARCADPDPHAIGRIAGRGEWNFEIVLGSMRAGHRLRTSRGRCSPSSGCLPPRNLRRASSCRELS